MGNAITQDTRYLWLMLVNDGGWWTASMLTRHWHPTFAPHEVQQALDALEAGGFLDSREQTGARNYAFTSDCKRLPDLPPVPALATWPGRRASPLRIRGHRPPISRAPTTRLLTISRPPR